MKAAILHPLTNGAQLVGGDPCDYLTESVDMAKANPEAVYPLLWDPESIGGNWEK